MLKILGKAASINVRKVLWCCDELGLPYAREDWGSGFRPTDTPDFLARNPNAMVPVIDDGGFVLWESNAILRYLAAQYGGAAIYPAGARERARVDQWLDWQACELNPAWRYAFMALARQSPAHRDAAQVAASVAAWSRCMGILERQLAATGGHAAGAGFSLADIALGLSVNRWYATPLAHPDYPAVAAYFARLQGRAGFARHGCNGMP